MWELCDILLGVIFIAATASNSLVLLVFYRRPGLRTLSNRFVINLLGTNLLSCWMLLPLVVAVPEFDADASVFCKICRLVSTALCSASVFSVLLIGIDQYYAVTDPLHYHSRINNTRSVILISASWIVSLSIGVSGAFFGGTSIWSCTDDASGRFPGVLLSIFAVCFTTLVFLLPFVTLCWIYISIYSAAHRNSQRARRNGSTSGFGNFSLADSHEYMIVPTSVSDSTSSSTLDSKSLSRSPTKCSLRSTSSFIVNSLRYRISNASLFRYREETRAARISALVVVMALVCWLPFSLVLLLDSPMLNLSVSNDWGKPSLTLLISGSIISPLLFAHRNRRIQRDLRKILGIARRSPGSVLKTYDRRKLSESQRNAKNMAPPDLSRTALELVGSLTEATNEASCCSTSSSFLNRVLCNRSGERLVTTLGKTSTKSEIKVPQIAIEIDTSRSSFSSGASTSTQRSTSAASISDVTEEF
ncbi:5-hydroxytryptamine receptor 1B-like [Lycorma delicatula]|uniref:5-hydroxytryptamine receptor 1B-like n=1 Tax=Lycorma delicatula TaxID=130591 RepID=UPI003F51A1A1